MIVIFFDIFKHVDFLHSQSNLNDIIHFNYDVFLLYKSLLMLLQILQDFLLTFPGCHCFQCLVAYRDLINLQLHLFNFLFKFISLHSEELNSNYHFQKSLRISHLILHKRVELIEWVQFAKLL